jgi:hypothetical protein
VDGQYERVCRCVWDIRRDSRQDSRQDSRRTVDEASEARAAQAAAEARMGVAEGALAEAQAALAGARGRCEQIGATQEELDHQHKEMERGVAAVSAQLGVKEGEISRLMGINAELGERAARAEQVMSVSQVGTMGAMGATPLILLSPMTQYYFLSVLYCPDLIVYNHL